jgi:erythromycin esterase
MLAREPADTRVVVVAHNNHIQKKPVSFDGELTAIPMGCYLAMPMQGDRGYRRCAIERSCPHLPAVELAGAREYGYCRHGGLHGHSRRHLRRCSG